MTGYAAYSGEASQYQVHKFMDLSYAEVTYFITQVATSAMSFGVAPEDLADVGTAINSLFNVRDGNLATVIPAQGAQLQSICTDETCPLAKNSTMVGYLTNVTEPSTVAAGAGSTATGSGSGSGSSTKTSSASHSGTATGTATGSGASASTSSTSTNGASAVGFSMLAVFGSVLGFFA